MSKLSPEDRFWAKVDKSGPGGCWLWTGRTNPKGYGMVSFGGQRRAHRIAWELLRGPIPEGLELDHLCRVRLCVNPAHLEPVTRKENILRGVGWGAKNAAKTHCIHGHEFTPENTYIRKPTAVQPFGRACRTCRRQRVRQAVAS